MGLLTVSSWKTCKMVQTFLELVPGHCNKVSITKSRYCNKASCDLLWIEGLAFNLFKRKRKIRKEISVKYNKAKFSKIRYVCILG